MSYEPKRSAFFPANVCPSADALPEGFLKFLEPLHRVYTPWQHELAAYRAEALAKALGGDLPGRAKSSMFWPEKAAAPDWRVELPPWISDQRNQMTGPADDAELCVKMLNSGAPGVMLDLEDSMANEWPNLARGIENAVAALHGELSFEDKKRGGTVRIKDSSTITFTRVRGLHMHQWGVFPDGPVSASLFDLAQLVYRVDPSRLKHPLCIYIPKTEHAEEGMWWANALSRIAAEKGMPADWIKCMALVEAHPFAYQTEEFIFHLRDHLIGLNLGRWDYMASLIHFTLADPRWVLPDRNTIPHDVPFFQNLRELLVETCHRRGIFAIGGMTALYPSRTDPELDARAKAALAKDKANEAACGFDGAWTGHPDQNEIAVNAFPYPNQLGVRTPDLDPTIDLRPRPEGVGTVTLAGTRAAVRTVIRYRYGVLCGKGASLLDGYMEDLATDRIYRLMIAQRMRHGVLADDGAGGKVLHSPSLVSMLFAEELGRLLRGMQKGEDASKYVEAARISQNLILNGEFDPS